MRMNNFYPLPKHYRNSVRWRGLNFAYNGSGVNEVALLQNFKNSRNSKGQFHLTPCYMKCFFGGGKKRN